MISTPIVYGAGNVWLLPCPSYTHPDHYANAYHTVTVQYEYSALLVHRKLSPVIR